MFSTRCKQLAELMTAQPKPAAAALLAAQQAYLDAVSEHVDDGDAEIRQRCIDTLNQSALACRTARALAMLQGPQRQKLLELQRQNRTLFASAFSENMTTRIEALRALAGKKDPKQLAEPLLVMCLWHSHYPLQTAAAEIIADQDYASGDLDEAVTDIIVRAIRRGYFNYDRGSLRPLESSCLLILSRRRPAEALPQILSAMLGNPEIHGSLLTDLLVQFNDKRVVPALVQRIPRYTSNYRYVWLPLVVARLTGQRPDDFGLRSAPDDSWYRLEDPAKTIRKVNEWWAKNKDLPPYKDLKPLPIPKLSPLSPEEAAANSGAGDDDEDITELDDAAITIDPSIQLPNVEVPPTTAPASRPQTAPASGPSLYSEFDMSFLTVQLRRLVAQRLVQMQADKPRTREQAQEALRALHQGMLDSLLQCCLDPDTPLLPVLSDLASRAQAAAALAQMPPEDRQKLRKFAKQHSNILRLYFSPTWRLQLQAMTDLRERLVISKGGGDLLDQAEPLVNLALTHPYAAIRNGGLELVGRCKYRGDRTIDTLCEMLGRTGEGKAFQGRIRFGSSDQSGGGWLSKRVLQLLRESRSRRCAPTLLSIMVNFQTNRYATFGDATVAEALAATGETGAIPALYQALQAGEEQSGNISIGNDKELYVSSKDGILLALVLLTSQNPRDYQLHRVEYGGTSVVGFDNASQRQPAKDKFKIWWQEHKDKPPYDRLKPLAVPLLPYHLRNSDEQESW